MSDGLGFLSNGMAAIDGSDAARTEAPQHQRENAEEQRERFSALLLRVAACGDRAAFSELFAFYAPRLKGYMLRLGAGKMLSEEIAQEVMLAVWRKADRFDCRRGSVSTWIFRIARNRRIDAVRRSKKPALDPLDPMMLPASFDAPEDLLDTRQVERSVREAMAQLSTEQRRILQLAFYEGKTHREIARVCALPLGTVKSRIRMALLKLRVGIPDDDGECRAHIRRDRHAN